MTAELWRAIPDHPGYEVSDQGRVLSRRLHRGDPGPRLLRPRIDSVGYARVHLRGENPTPARVHRLVLAAFVGPLPKGHVTRHLNGDKTDNRLENLAYGTHLENSIDTVDHGQNVNASKTHCIHGHEFTPENTYISPNYTTQSRRTYRACRTCQRATWARSNAKRTQRARQASCPHLRPANTPCGPCLAAISEQARP